MATLNLNGFAIQLDDEKVETIKEALAQYETEKSTNCLSDALDTPDAE